MFSSYSGARVIQEFWRHWDRGCRGAVKKCQSKLPQSAYFCFRLLGDLQSEDNSQCTILSKQSQTFVVLRQLAIVKAVSNRYHSLVNGDSCMAGERPGSTNSTIYKVLYDWLIKKVTRYRLRPCATFNSMRH